MTRTILRLFFANGDLTDAALFLASMAAVAAVLIALGAGA